MTFLLFFPNMFCMSIKTHCFYVWEQKFCHGKKLQQGINPIRETGTFLDNAIP
jgi:hypothetical protein